MSVTVHSVTPEFVAEVGDVDLARPLDPADLAAIRAAFTRHAVLVFPDQHFDDDSQLDFARHFGPLETTVFKARQGHKLRLHENMADVGNLDAENRILDTSDRQRLYNLGNRLWHTDSSFKRLPAYCSMLHARSIPPIGGQTEFADMRAAYDTLDDDLKAEVADSITEHSNAYSREQIGIPKAEYGEENQIKLKPVRQRLVRYDSRTGRKSLYLSAHIGAIVGWPIPEGRMLIRELIEHATQRKFVYAHAWRQWDLVVWDNRTTMHRARRYNDLHDVRDMRRTTIRGEGITAEQTQEAA